MFFRRVAVAGKRFASIMAQSVTPVEDGMRAKERRPSDRTAGMRGRNVS